MIIKKKFDSRNIYWDVNREFNQLFLRSVLTSFNYLLKFRGFVLLFEVYEKLGFEATRESCMNGWSENVDKSIKVSISQNDGDLELSFDCYPILEYLEKEEAAE